MTEHSHLDGRGPFVKDPAPFWESTLGIILRVFLWLIVAAVLGTALWAFITLTPFFQHRI